MSDENVSTSLEDYLEKIYFLSRRMGDVRVTDLANEMGISKASVNKAINILKKQNLVLHEHYGLLQLTDKGLIKAKDIAKRHVIFKQLLGEVIGVEDDVAEEEACQIEHLVSTTTVEKLEKFLNDYYAIKRFFN